MPGYQVTFPEVGSASAALAGLARQLREELRRLSSAVDAVLGVGWRGRAAGAFELDWRAWHAAATDVVLLLDELALTLGAGGDAYEVTESGVRSAFAR